MVKIRLDGYVGDTITANSLSEQLDALSGEDIVVNLNTQGGFVYEGIEVYNRLMQYPGKKTLVMGALVASIGSYILSAFDVVQAQDFSGFMIHNVQSGTYGDSEELRKEADAIDRLNVLIAERLSERSGKTVDEIKELMNAETWYYGKEIVDAGFADELIETGKKPNKENAMQAVACMKKRYINDLKEKNSTGGAAKINEEGVQMDKNELLKNIQTFRTNGDITLLEVAKVMGLEDQLLTDNAKNCIKIVKELEKAGFKDPVNEFPELKKKADEAESAKRENLLTEKFGNKMLKDAAGNQVENVVRQYAEQRFVNGAKIEEIEKDPVMVTLKAASADYQSPQNRILIREGDRQNQGDSPETVTY